MPTALPITAVLPELLSTLASHTCVLLSAQPGAGKTTVVPLALLNEAWLQGQKIILLEPRRMAARNAATFMANSLGESVGETVGYRIRLESKVSERTRIEVVTEGILTRMLQADPELNGVGLIIFDEFHERHLHADLGLALALQSQELLRDDLKILVMSATLDEQKLTTTLDAPLIHCEGRSFPLELQYRALSNNQSLIDLCTKTIHEALTYPGDMLVFLPGVGEIKQLQERLQSLPEPCLVLPLHGQLTDKEQKAALAPANGQRKVILATNIAESSLTIDGVRIVIDSGLERRVEFHVSSGLSELKTRSISQASSQQRAGRAARQHSGVCFRLWPESQQDRLDAFIQPEILSADLAPLLLELYQWGTSYDELFWLNSPPAAAIHKAQDLLFQLGFLSADKRQLSPHGKTCSTLGIEPRLAHALVTLHSLNASQYATELIALMQEFPANRRQSDDLTKLYQQAKNNKHLWHNRIQPLAKRLLLLLKDITVTNTHSVAEEDIPALLLALAYPDFIAKKRSTNEQFLLANGRGAVLSQQSDLVSADWIACADFSIRQQTVIRLGTALSEHLLNTLEQLAPQLFSTQTVIGFQESGQFTAKENKQLGHLVLDSKPLPSLTAEQWQDAWKDYIKHNGLDCLNWTEEALQMRARLSFAATHLNTDKEAWPEISTAALLNSLEHWLLPFLHEARHIRHLEKVNLSEALLSLLDWSQQQKLNTVLPTHFKVPSGSNIKIDYNHNPPVLAVKLQEMFGYEGQPSVLNGQVPLVIHLLSPARRPLQVTSDLPHFWRNTYAEVRKDMRGRYPKHPWPEDPLAASATRFTKAALQRQSK